MSDGHLLAVEELTPATVAPSVLRGVDLHVDAGEIVSLIGSNGAGKSTLLKAIVGLVTPSAGNGALRGAASHGSAGPRGSCAQGVALVPEGRLLFGPLSVADNLELVRTRPAAHRSARSRRAPRAGARAVPGARRARRAVRRARSPAASSRCWRSGARSCRGPRLLLLDEPSLGLAPKVIAEIFSALERLRADGVTMLLVEQDAKLALKHSDRGYVMRTGQDRARGQRGGAASPTSRFARSTSVRGRRRGART